ncbi:MAG: type 4a pilus biogenesis protein PilO [Actinomycetota bacterium]|nr:type 4a pilus biogenesis protein PilO [Actinomycetota bacterium]
MTRRIPLPLVVALAFLIVAGTVYFAAIEPKRSEAARLKQELRVLETRRASTVAHRHRAPAVRIDVADVFRLAKAIPNQEDMAGILLELDSLASATGIDFLSVTPTATDENSTNGLVSVTVTFDGSYYDVVDFIFRLRNLVTVEDGKLDARGRFYTLSSLDLHEAEGGFPDVEAVLTVSAYVFNSPAEGDDQNLPSPTTAAEQQGSTSGSTPAPAAPTSTSPPPAGTAGANGSSEPSPPDRAAVGGAP